MVDMSKEDQTRNRELVQRFQEAQGNGSTKKTPFRAFDLNVEDGRKENIDKLLGELKIYLQTKEELSKSKPKNHSDNKTVTRRENVPLLIKPLVTDMKQFLKTVEDSNVDGKTEQVKMPKIQSKLSENVFKPIQFNRPEKAPIFSKEESIESENIVLTTNGKSIHESLRMLNIKRRKSLPSFDERKESSENLSTTENENSKSYNVSYYTSIPKGKQSDTGSNEYYSSSLTSSKDKKNTEVQKREVYPHKSVSDDYVYGANKLSKSALIKLPTSVSTDSIKQDYGYGVGRSNDERPLRISVTEPSSPASAYTSKNSKSSKVLKTRHENTESDVSGSESEYSYAPTVSKVKKSKSFVEQKASKKNFEPSRTTNATTLQAKNSKGSKVRSRKSSRSSTSSCDSFCPQSIRKSQKLKLDKGEIENKKPLKLPKFESNSMNLPPKSSSKKKRSCLCVKNSMHQENLEFGSQGRFRDRMEEATNPPRVNASSWTRERERSSCRDAKARERPSSTRMTAEMYLHLLDVLLQKNQNENVNESPQQSGTKSLPRNHKSKSVNMYPHKFSHHLTTAIECEKDSLKILKSFPNDKTEGNPVYRSVQINDQSPDANNRINFTPKKKPVNPDNKGSDERYVKNPGSSSNFCSGRRLETSLGQCGCTLYSCCGSFCEYKRSKYFPKSQHVDAGKFKKVDGMDRLEKLVLNRGRAANLRDEECVIRIEDEKLWIKICKAVEEVNLKEKNLKKSD